MLFIFSVQVYTKYYNCLKSKAGQLACKAQRSGAAIYAIDYINNNLKNEKIASFFDVQYKYILNNNNNNNIDYTFCIDETRN
jgi:hypothetical protein